MLVVSIALTCFDIVPDFSHPQLPAAGKAEAFANTSLIVVRQEEAAITTSDIFARSV